MQILAISELKTGATFENVKPHLAEEIRDTVELYLRDVIRDYYLQGDGNGVVFMMNCESVEAARAELAELTLMREGISDFRLIPLNPLKPLGMLLKN